MPLIEFERAVGHFSIMLAHEREPASDIVRELNKIADLSERLYFALANSSDELSGYLGSECVRTGYPKLDHEIKSRLPKLKVLAENARQDAGADIARGRSISETTKFVWALADILDRAGVSPSASVNGPLVLAFGIALDEVGHTVASNRDTVRKALQARETIASE